MNGDSFSEGLQKYLRSGGYSQKQLADALALHPKVLSRKLNESGNAHLTHQELQRIIVQLAEWRAITTQDEACQLLELAQVEPSIISEDQWQAPPLSTLTARRPPPPLTTVSEPNLPTSIPLHNLPAPTTRLIGRDWAVGRLQQQLERNDVRLITLVGTGGSGKTRLALHIASEVAASFEHGVWFVGLAGVRDAVRVPLSIIQALNITPTSSLPPLQSLISYLKNKQLLLILDNFEQVVEATTILDEMLSGVPGLKVLVTSRAILHMHGENKFSVPPLDVPDPDIKLKTMQLLQYGSVQLFVERAQAVAPDFALTEENTTAVAQICAKVDGLPLALELAAARIRALPPDLLLARLTQAPLSMLTKGARNLPDRQQTLRNTIVWSYNLLSPDEQLWFCRLGVFNGGWSLEAAEAMMHDIGAGQGDADPLDILEQMVDNSLVVRLPEVSGQARFIMLETLREFAQEQLAAQGDLERLRDWHASYYMKKAEAAELGLRGPRQFMWLARLTIDRNNFRAAMEWSLQRAREGLKIRTFSVLMQETYGRSKAVAGSKLLSTKGVARLELPAIELCLRLGASFRPYWEWYGYLIEARAWLGAALEIPITGESEETVQAARAKALSEHARLASLQNNQARGIELVQASIALWKQLNDPSGLATALFHRGWTAHALNDYETAQSVYREGLQLLTEPADNWLRAQIMLLLAAAVGFTGDFEQMNTLYAQSRELFEQLGDKSSIADLLKDSGGMMLLESRYTEAIDNLLTSLTMCYEMGHKQFVATGMGWLSFAFGLREKPDTATACIYSAQLEGATDSLMDSIGLTPWLRTHPLTQWVRQQIRSRVDKQTWEEAYAAGRALTVKQAIDLAYGWRDSPQSIIRQINTQEGYSSST